MKDITYHDDETISKVYAALLRSGLDEKQSQNAVIALLNAGILFREMRRCETPIWQNEPEPAWAGFYKYGPYKDEAGGTLQFQYRCNKSIKDNQRCPWTLVTVAETDLLPQDALLLNTHKVTQH